MPQAINTVVLDPLQPEPNRAEVLYMTPGGQIQPYENGRHRGKCKYIYLISIKYISH